jgi:hypothetical protein
VPEQCKMMGIHTVRLLVSGQAVAGPDGASHTDELYYAFVRVWL